MKRALGVYVVTGVNTTVPFHIRVMNTRHFIEGNFDTNFIEQVFFREEEVRPLETGSWPGHRGDPGVPGGAEERVDAATGSGGTVSMWKYSTRPGIRKIG